MLPDLSELYIIGPAIVVIGIVFFGFRLRIVQETNPLRKAFRLYELHLAAIAAFLTVVWLTIPITSVLRTFGHPQSIEDINNRALIRTAAALHWFVLVFVAWFLLNTYRFCKALVSALSEKN